MKAAGDIRAGDQRKELVVSADPECAVTLANVAIDINGQRG
jgi:hypothetical protein